MKVEQLEGYLAPFVDRMRLRNSNIQGCCPFHQESNPSWGMSINPPYLHGCYSCGARGTLFTFLVNVAGYTKVAAKRICSYSDMEGNLDLKSEVRPIIQIIDDSVLFPFIWDQTVSAYLQSRNFEPRKLVDLGLCHNRKEHRLLFPWYLGKDLIGVTGRALDDNPAKTLPYYSTLKGMCFYLPARTLNLPSLRPLIIVEGELDAIRIFSQGLYNVGALGFGAFTRTHRDLILTRAISEVILFFDDDETGRRLTDYTTKMMQGLCKVSVVDYAPFRDKYHKKLDPGEMTPDDIDLAIKRHTVKYADWPRL